MARTHCDPDGITRGKPVIRFKRFNLRGRIFLAMMGVVLITSSLMILVVLFHFEKTNDEYHQTRLKQKESSIHSSIGYIIAKSPQNATPANIQSMLETRIYELSQINGLEISIFNLSGGLYIASNPPLLTDGPRNRIPADLMREIHEKGYASTEGEKLETGPKYRSHYSFLCNLAHQPVAILKVTYVQDDSLLMKELHSFLKNVSFLYLLIITGSAGLSFLLSKSITRQLEVIRNRLRQTQLTEKNEQIQYTRRDELRPLVDAYNEMVVKLEESTERLAKSAREYAWREMARQIAHEIKNPLTPMRLMIQNFMQHYDPKAEGAAQKLKDFSDSMIQQIDTLSGIASAFSDFARMPPPKDEAFALDEALATALDLFDRQSVSFKAGTWGVSIFMDKSQFNRMVINLVKNALQSISSDRKPEVKVYTGVKGASHILIEIRDNGRGILPERQKLIFEPRFTTKTGGMGLGLGIVRGIVESYGGKIYFKTRADVGTSFYIELPIEKKAL